MFADYAAEHFLRTYPSYLYVLLHNSIHTTLIVREIRYCHIIERHWVKHRVYRSKTPSYFHYRPSQALISKLAGFLATSVAFTLGQNNYIRYSQYIPENVLGYDDNRLFTLVCDRNGEVITVYPRHY